MKFSSSDVAVVRELVTGCGPPQCFLTEPACVLARDHARCGLQVSLSGVRLDLPGQFAAASGASLRELGELAYRIDDLLEQCFRETSQQAPGPYLGPVWYFWDRESIQISTPGWTTKVADIRVAFCVDDQVSGEYLTIYGRAGLVTGDRVTELTEPLLLAHLHPDEAATRWARINAEGSRVVIMITPERVTGRQNVR